MPLLLPKGLANWRVFFIQGSFLTLAFEGKIRLHERSTTEKLLLMRNERANLIFYFLLGLVLR